MNKNEYHVVNVKRSKWKYILTVTPILTGCWNLVACMPDWRTFNTGFQSGPQFSLTVTFDNSGICIIRDNSPVYKIIERWLRNGFEIYAHNIPTCQRMKNNEL